MKIAKIAVILTLLAIIFMLFYPIAERFEQNPLYRDARPTLLLAALILAIAAAGFILTILAERGEKRARPLFRDTDLPL